MSHGIKRVVGDVVGALGGGALGAATGAGAGAAVGTLAGPEGIVAGAVIGAVAAGAGGMLAGGTQFDQMARDSFEHKPRAHHGAARVFADVVGFMGGQALCPIPLVGGIVGAKMTDDLYNASHSDQPVQSKES